jgi:hypothetical protein
MTNPKDRHVAAAAAAIAPCVLVTNNLKDFDADELAELGVRVLSPDDFLVELFDASPDFIETATREAAANLSKSMPCERIFDRSRDPRRVEEIRGAIAVARSRLDAGWFRPELKSTRRLVRTASETAVAVIFLIPGIDAIVGSSERSEWCHSWLKSFLRQGTAAKLRAHVIAVRAMSGYGMSVACGKGQAQMRQATNIRKFIPTVLPPELSINTGPKDYARIKQVQLTKFEGERWMPLGDPVKGN